VLGSNGLIGQVAIDTPAFEFNADGSYKGLLVEPGATNINLYSEDLSNAFYTKTSTTITANSVTSPDGSLNADTATFAVGGSFGYFYSFGGNTSVAFSFFVKKGNYTSLNVLEQFYFATSITFNLDAKTATSGGKVEDYGNGWLRCSWVQAYGVAQTIISWRFAEVNGAAGTADFYGFQAETGSVATSYIPTEGSTVTRTADDISLTSASSLIGQTEGTMYAEFDHSRLQSGRILVLEPGSDAGNFVAIEGSGTPGSFIIRIVATVGTFSYTVAGVAGINKIAFGYKSADSAFSANGGAVTADATIFSFGATLGQVNIGSTTAFGAAAIHCNGWIRGAALFPTRLTNAQLIALTS